MTVMEAEPRKVRLRLTMKITIICLIELIMPRKSTLCDNFRASVHNEPVFYAGHSDHTESGFRDLKLLQNKWVEIW